MSQQNAQDFDRISDSFKGKTILISGATGFMGKVLLEKLLRCCSDLQKVYLLIRSKNGQRPAERLEKMFEGPLFDLLRTNNSFHHLKSKVEAIECNVSILGLNLPKKSESKLVNEVHFVYNCAANLRFDETLKTSTIVNVFFAQFLLSLAKRMQNLQVFCHVSAAYCNIHQRVIYERIYDPPMDAQKLMDIVAKSEDGVLSAITHKVLDDFPNIYCFTKAICESLIASEFNQLPTVIVRPSIVTPAWKEPIPGWTDTINNMIGFQIVGGKGILRTLYGDFDKYPDMVPVDIAISAFLCITYHFQTYRSQRVFNITSSSEHKITMMELMLIGRDVIQGPVPLNWVAWYPGGTVWPYKWLHHLMYFVQHLIPGLIVDLILKLCGQKPILMRIYRRIFKGFEIMYVYNGRQWDFNNDASLAARDLMNPIEKAKYNLYGDRDYFTYFANCVLCARRYILDEPDETLPTARRHMKIMYWVDKVATCLAIWMLYTLIF